ncbi:MAG: glycosyltransferase [Actinobacteria bacterium]|nr:glycosyltransferase [Actinomycetota bacterium]
MAVVAYHSSPLAEPGSGDAGGMSIFVRGLAEALARKGLRTDVFTRRNDDATPVTTVADGVRVIAIDAGPPESLEKDAQLPYLGDFVAGVRAFAASQRLRYDLVHSHYWQSGLAAKRLSTFWDVPLVHSNHTLAKVKNRFLAPGDRPESDRRLQGEAEVIAASDVLAVSTDDELQQLACLYGAPHDRLKTVYPGVDHALFMSGLAPQPTRARLGLTDEATLLYVGRIQPLKGLELAIRSVDELSGAMERDVVLLVVGGASGPAGDAELERLRLLASSLSVDDRVRFLGPQPHSSLPDLYAASDVVVACSHTESFGLAALEAHACGRPVVATAVGGLSHIVADGVTGYLVHERDPSVFAGHLKTLLSDDELRQRFGAAALARSNAFGWDRSADEFLELYECLAAVEHPEFCTC